MKTTKNQTTGSEAMERLEQLAQCAKHNPREAVDIKVDYVRDGVEHSAVVKLHDVKPFKYILCTYMIGHFIDDREAIMRICVADKTTGEFSEEVYHNPKICPTYNVSDPKEIGRLRASSFGNDVAQRLEEEGTDKEAEQLRVKAFLRYDVPIDL